MINKGVGKVYQKRPGHWYIQLPGKVRIYCDKGHQSLDSEKRAQATLIGIYNEMKNGTFDPDFYRPSRKSRHSFSVYADYWISFREQMAKQGKLAMMWHRQTANVVNKLFKPYFGDDDMQAIQGQQLRLFQLSMTEYSLKTVRDRMILLMKIFRDAKADGIVQEVPVIPDEIKREDVPDPDWQWTDEETQEKIFAELDHESLYFILFQATHATRTGETRALQHQDIDLENDTVTIRRAFSGHFLRFTKTKRERVLPLDPTWKELYLRQPRVFDKTQFVFLNKRSGKPYHKSYMPKKWTIACNKVGVKDLDLYSGTRHSLASQAANRGESLYLIKEFLGHASITTTQRYAHLAVAPLKAIQRKTITLASNLPPKAVGEK